MPDDHAQLKSTIAQAVNDGEVLTRGGTALAGVKQGALGAAVKPVSVCEVIAGTAFAAVGDCQTGTLVMRGAIAAGGGNVDLSDIDGHAYFPCVVSHAYALRVQLMSVSVNADATLGLGELLEYIAIAHRPATGNAVLGAYSAMSATSVLNPTGFTTVITFAGVAGGVRINWQQINTQALRVIARVDWSELGFAP